MPTDPRDDQYQANHDSRFDNDPEFDTHRTSTSYDDPSLITTDSAAEPGDATGASDQPDLMGLAGVEPDEDDLLLSQEDRLDLGDSSGGDRTPKTRSIATAGPPRTVAVAGVLGVIVLFTVAFMGLFGGGGEQVAEEPETEEDREEELFSESDAYRSRLALVDQQREREERGEMAEPSDPIEEPEEEDSEPEPTQASSPPPPQDSTPPPRQSAPPPPAPQQSAPPPAPAQQSTPEPDPFEQWNTLAQAGTQGDSFDLVEPVEEAQASADPRSAEAALANGGGGSHGGQGNGSRNGIPVATIGSFGGLGGGTPSSSSNSRSNAPTTAASAQPTQPAQSSTALSSGAQGILDRGSQGGGGHGGQPQEMEVLLGSTVRGRLTVPIVASQRGDTLGRFAVELVEPLRDAQGNTALPAGTTLITEVQSIDNNTLAIQQSVVAVIYEDSQGQVQQETLTPDTLIIRGGNGGALIASQQGGSSARGGGDILTVGAASALAEVGRNLNADDLIQTTSATAGPDSSSTTTTTVRESGGANVLGAALEGFFGASVERLQAEAEAAAESDQTEPVLVVEGGRDLQVFVNGFLTVRR